MAKVNNPATQGLRGTIKGLTFVHSKRYGDHVRNPRGTFKPAVLNETMEQSKNNLLQVNETASLFFNSIRNEHKDGTLWTRLLSALRRQLKENNHNDVQCLLNLECHAFYTLQKMLRSSWFIDPVKIEKRRLYITVEMLKAPVCGTKRIPEFQLSLHVIYADRVNNRLHKEVVYSDIFSKDNYPEELSFVVPVPARVTTYAVFLKVTECRDGEPKNWPQSTGMRCVAVGVIEQKQTQPANRKAATRKKQPGAGKHRRKGSGQK